MPAETDLFFALIPSFIKYLKSNSALNSNVDFAAYT